MLGCYHAYAEPVLLPLHDDGHLMEGVALDAELSNPRCTIEMGQCLSRVRLGYSEGQRGIWGVKDGWHKQLPH